jgi:hypothetical protein
MMGQSEAEFDSALGAYEDGLLNSHLAEEDKWDHTFDKAEEKVWEMKLSELHEMAPVDIAKQMDAIAEAMIEHVAQSIADDE